MRDLDLGPSVSGRVCRALILSEGRAWRTQGRLLWRDIPSLHTVAVSRCRCAMYQTPEYYVCPWSACGVRCICPGGERRMRTMRQQADSERWQMLMPCDVITSLCQEPALRCVVHATRACGATTLDGHAGQSTARHRVGDLGTGRPAARSVGVRPSRCVAVSGLSSRLRSVSLESRVCLVSRVTSLPLNPPPRSRPKMSFSSISFSWSLTLLRSVHTLAPLHGIAVPFRARSARARALHTSTQ